MNYTKEFYQRVLNILLLSTFRRDLAVIYLARARYLGAFPLLFQLPTTTLDLKGAVARG